MAAVPYFQLSSFYFFYFALLGATLPYWVLYLQSLGFDAATIGMIMASSHASRIFAPALWGWIADRSEQRMCVIRWGASATFCVYLLIFFQQSALGIGLVMLGYSFFWNAVLPQFEVVTLKHLHAQPQRYSQIRLWGSIGFILAVASTGLALEHIDISWLPWILLLFVVCIGVTTWLVSEPKKTKTAQQTGQLKDLLRQPQIIAFFAITFFTQLSHGAYYTFYSVLLAQTGYEKSTIAYMWSLGVIAEVGVFAVMHSLIKTLGLRRIMLCSLLVCVCRWLMIGHYSASLVLLVVAQLMHAATFGCLHAVGVALVDCYFPDNTKGQGQALFSSLGFGLGGTAGALLSGYLWQYSGASITFSVAAGAAMLAFVLACVWIWPEKVQKNTNF